MSVTPDRESVAMPALAPLYGELVERVCTAIDAARGAAHVAVANKGAVEDMIPGLSDIDFRLVLDTDDPEAWRRVGAAFAAALLAFAEAHRDGGRLVEHMPAFGYASDALDARPVYWERVTWTPLWASAAHVLPGREHAGVAGVEAGVSASSWWAGKLLGYQPPYEAQRDPPINVAAADLPRFPAFSLVWHFYAPALHAGAQRLGEAGVRSKWDALRWRAGEGVATAERALALAEAGFAGEIDGGLVGACERDVQALARSVVDDASQPWETLRAEAETIAYSLRDRRLWALATARTYVHRWWFYAHAPEGYDVAAVLKIDRGHIGRFTLRPLLESDEAMDALRGHARDARRLQAALDALMAQHRSTATGDPRRTFMAMRENYRVVLDALEGWHAAA